MRGVKQCALEPELTNGCNFGVLESGLQNFLTVLLRLGQLFPHAAGSVPFSGKASLPGLRDSFLDPLWLLSCVADNLCCQISALWINEILITP